MRENAPASKPSCTNCFTTEFAGYFFGGLPSLCSFLLAWSWRKDSGPRSLATFLPPSLPDSAVVSKYSP